MDNSNDSIHYKYSYYSEIDVEKSQKRYQVLFPLHSYQILRLSLSLK